MAEIRALNETIVELEVKNDNQKREIETLEKSIELEKRKNSQDSEVIVEEWGGIVAGSLAQKLRPAVLSLNLHFNPVPSLKGFTRGKRKTIKTRRHGVGHETRSG